MSLRAHRFWLAALLLVAALAPRAGAKPPDLPLPVEDICAPVATPGQATPCPNETTPSEPPHRVGFTFTRRVRVAVPNAVWVTAPVPTTPTRSLADQCATMRTLTRCFLFNFSPFAEWVRVDRQMNFDEDHPFPVISTEAGDVYTRQVGRMLLSLCSSPFASYSYFVQLAEEPTPAAVVVPVTPAATEEECEEPAGAHERGGPMGCMYHGPYPQACPSYYGGCESMGSSSTGGPVGGVHHGSCGQSAAFQGGCGSMPCVVVKVVAPCPVKTCVKMSKCPLIAKVGQICHISWILGDECGCCTEKGCSCACCGEGSCPICAGLIRMGDDLFRSHRPAEAMQCYQWVLNLCPNAEETRHAAFGVYLCRLVCNMHQKAEGDCEEAEAKTPAKEQSECPYLREKASKPAPTTSKVEEQPTVLDQLKKLEKAAQLYKKAEHYLHEGDAIRAAACYEQIHQMVPGSRYDEMAQERLTSMPLPPRSSTEAEGEEEAIPEKSDRPVDPNTDKPDMEVLGVDFSGETPRLVRTQYWNLGCGKTERGWRGCGQKFRTKAKKTAGDQEENSLAGRESKLEKQLERVVSMNYQEAPLAHVLDDVRGLYGVNIVPDRAALEEEGVSLDRTVSLRVVDVPLKKALAKVLKTVRLDSMIKDGVMVVTTPRVVHGPVVTCNYDVSDLVSSKKVAGEKVTRQSRARMEQMAGSDLVKLVLKTISPETWADGNGVGSIEYLAGTKSLVICHTPAVQEQVEDFLAKLRKDRSVLNKKPTSKKTSTTKKVVDHQHTCPWAGRNGNTIKASACVEEADKGTPRLARSEKTVYKVNVLKDVLPTVTLKPMLPPIDPTIVQAYQQILELVPPRCLESESAKDLCPEENTFQVEVEKIQFEVVPADSEEAETVEATETSHPLKHAICIDTDFKCACGGPRIRCQMQLGMLTLCVKCEKGANTLSIGLGVSNGPEKKD